MYVTGTTCKKKTVWHKKRGPNSVNVQTMRTIVQIFVAFSEILNFTLGLARNSNLDINLTYNIVSVTIFICYFFRMRLSNVNRTWNETQIISTLPWLPWPQLTCKTGHVFLKKFNQKTLFRYCTQSILSFKVSKLK